MPAKAALAAASGATLNVVDAAAPPGKAASATIEQTYQKLTQHQHILQRPDTYVGSIESVTTDMFVMDTDTGRMVNRSIKYVPALYKVFDEIVVNAADNKQRDSNMTELKIEIDREKNRLSVYNNGQGVPVVMHKEHNIYVPELIFGTRATRPDRRAPARPSRPCQTVTATYSLPLVGCRPPARWLQLQ